MAKSHILMPHFLLKKFVDHENTLYYIDCKTDAVRKGRAKTFFTQEGYYSDHMEAWLNKNIESKVATLISFLERTKFEDKEEISFDYVDFAYRHLYALLARAPYLIEVINNNSVFFQFSPAEDQHQMAVQDIFRRLWNDRYFQDGYTVGFVNNISEESFVLATSGVCVTDYGIVCPITPNKAILFWKTGAECDHKTPLFEISNGAEIFEINKLQLIQEKRFNNTFVVANSEDCLKRLLCD